MDLELARRLAVPGTSKVLFCVVSGLGGLDKHETLRSELERADTPNLDRLTTRSEVGLTIPIGRGITPSGIASCLALLGYDPFEVRLESGALVSGSGEAVASLQATWGVRVAVAAASSALALSRVAVAAGAEILPLPRDDGEGRAGEGDLVEAAIHAIRGRWDDFDVFILGFDKAALAAADGDFELKATTFRELDSRVPDLLALGADVLVVAGDHSLPALVGRASWHPVPFLLHSEVCREGGAQHFNEQECLRGSLGMFPATDVMPLVMAHANRLQPFGG